MLVPGAPRCSRMFDVRTELSGEPQEVLTQGDDVEAKALRARGWTISAIARHLRRDRKTVRAYLDGTRTPGQRAGKAEDPFDRFGEYCRSPNRRAGALLPAWTVGSATRAKAGLTAP